MGSIQHKRRESILFQEISKILFKKIENANISYVTVTDVKLSNDQSILKVYVTFENNALRSFEYLNNTKGFVRSQIAKIKILKKVPEIVFKFDRTQEKARKIEEIIKKIKNNN